MKRRKIFGSVNNYFYMKYISLICLSLYIFVSCTSVNTLLIDIEKPPTILLPTSVENITVVNNSAKQPKDSGHKELFLNRDVSKLISVNNDSIDIILMQTLADGLNLTGKFENVHIFENPTRSDNDYTESIDLPKEKLKDIANEANADIMLVVNKFYLETTTNSIPAYYYNIDSYNTLDLGMNLDFRYYSKTGEAISPNIEIQDTISWIEGISYGTVISDPIPSREDAMKIGSEILAKSVSSQMMIGKESVGRVYYGDVKTANKFVAKNQWKEAADSWQEAFNKETNNKKKGRIATNIALSYELNDNIDDAISWINTSIELFSLNQNTRIDKEYLENAKLYQQELLQRKQDFEILDKIGE